jgi:Domain of unknown function (DUF1906)
MTEQLLADFATARPSPQALLDAGYLGALRYLCDDRCEAAMPGKRITPAELAGYRDAGLSVALCWENGAADAAGGNTPGAYAAGWINRLCDALGWPAGLPVYATVDYDAPPSAWPSVAAYLNRVAWDTGRPGAMYGKAPLGEQMIHDGHIVYLWQSEAWSGSYVSPQARLYQRVTPTKTVGGLIAGSWDENMVLNADCGLWVPDGAVIAPTNAPQPNLPASPASIREWWREHPRWRW